MTSALDTCFAFAFAFAFDPQVFLATFVSTRQSEKKYKKTETE